MTSGAIQHGVPTNVLRTLFRVMSPPVARKALTPKSAGSEEKRKKKEYHWSFSSTTAHVFTSNLGWTVVWIPAICTEPSSPRRMFPAFRSLPKIRVCTLHNRFSRWAVTDELIEKALVDSPLNMCIDIKSYSLVCSRVLKCSNPMCNYATDSSHLDLAAY